MSEVHSIHIKVDSTDAQKASRNLSDMEKATNGAERALSNLTRAAVGLVALDKIGQVAKGILDTNRAMEALRAQLVAVTGSAVGAQRAFSFIQNFAVNTPYEIEGLTKAFIALQNYGIKPTKQVMEAVTNQASKLGASQETLDGIVRALGQAYAKGKLQAEEMLQLAERGVPVYDLLSQVTGKNAAQLQEMASKGELTRQTIEKLIGVMNQAATGANAAAMDTLNGKISNLSDAWHQFEDTLLNDKSEGILKSIVDGVTAQINRMTSALKETEVQRLEKQIGMLKQTPGYDVPIAGLEKQLDAAKKVEEQQKKASDEANKAEDARVAKAEEATKKLLGNGESVVKSKKEQSAATKALHEAEAAYTATIEANLRLVMDRAKVQDARSQTSEKRLQFELSQAKAAAEVSMQAAKTDEERLKIQEELAAKAETIITKENELKQQQIAIDEEILQSRIEAIEQEISAADRFNLSQSERIRLQAELQSLQTQQEIFPEERAQLEIESMRQLQDAYSEVNKLRAEAADGEAKVREEALRTLDVLSSNLEYSRELARGLADAFGEVGAAIGGMSVAMAEYDKQSATVEIARQEAITKAAGDQKKIDEANTTAAKKQSQAEIKKYGDMTQAAQGFFKKGTAGYKAMETATKAFRALEVAQQAMSFAEQLGGMDKLFGSFETMLKQMGILSDMNKAKEIANSQAAGTQKALEGAAQQGTEGDPYTAFARVAAWIALMAGLGFMVGGGAGGSAPPPPPALAGTGTVKGDPTKQSESIARSLEILTENSTNDLNYSADMLEALQNIESALASASDLIASKVLPVIGEVVSRFTSDSMLSSSSVKEAGFLIGSQSLTKVLESGLLKGQLGARIETEQFGLLKSGKTLTMEYGKDIASAFGKIVQTIYKSIEEVAKAISIPTETIADRAEKLKISLGKINLAGMSAEEAAKAVAAAVSAMSDKMAQKLLPEFKDFQRNGEGYFETINRVAEGINRATGNLELLGMQAINYTEITDKQKDVAAEITRQTIMAQGDLTDGTREYVRQLQGSAEDIVESYKKILDITNLMKGAGFGTEGLDRTLINAAGGLDEFASSLQSFYDNFLSDEQRVAAQTAQLTAEFGKLGYSLPKSKDEFARLAQSIDRSTEDGKKLFAALIRLSQGFSDLIDSSKELADAQAEAAQKAAEEAKQAEVKRLEDISKAQDEAAARAKKAYDDAGNALKKAFDDLGKVRDRFANIGKTLNDYLDELTGVKSLNASPETRYKRAREELDRVKALAAAGDEEALKELVQSGKDFLDASREYNASSEAYQQDFELVLASIEEGKVYAQSQVNLATQQLDVARAQYSQLKEVDQSLMSVDSGISNLNNAMKAYNDAAKANADAIVAAINALGAAQAAAKAPASGGGGSGSGSGSGSAPSFGSMTLPDGRTIYPAIMALGQSNSGGGGGGSSSGGIVNVAGGFTMAAGLPGAGTFYKYAEGGPAVPGLALVGEQGPELVSFGSPSYVSTASQTQGFFEGIQNTIASGDKQQVEELQALVRLQSAANQQLIKEMKELKGEMAELSRKAKLEAAA